MMLPLAQLHPNANEIGLWLACAATVLGIVAIIKTVFIRKPPIEAEFVRRVECKEIHSGTAFALAEIKKEIRDLEVSVRTEIRSLAKDFDVSLRDFNLLNERRSGDLHKRINEVVERVSKLEGTLHESSG